MKLPLLIGVALGLAAAPSAVAAPRADILAARATVPAHARVLGAATDAVDVLVSLRQRNLAGLKEFDALVSDPSSSLYQRYLTPAQFRARFAPSAASVDAVRAFAAANGLTVASVPSNHAFVELKGSAAAAAKAFATPLEAVRVAGRLAHVPTGTPSVPANLGGIVTGIEGLDTSRVLHPLASSYPDAYVNGKPCSTYYGEKVATTLPGAYGTDHFPYAPCGYDPSQLRAAYGMTDVVKQGIDGSGVTIAIIDAFDYTHAQADANLYADHHGEPHLKSYLDKSEAAAAQIPEAPDGLELDPNGWAGEQQLDVEAIHAMAPGAAIVYHGATTPLNVTFSQAQNAVVNNKEAQIVSNSYGGAEDDADASTEALLMQAAAEGIGFYFSTGDEGDETKDPNGPGDREVNSSANQPMATGVGGTSLAVGKDNAYEFETGWGTTSSTLTNGAFTAPGDFTYGGGGGTSQVYGQPSYQAGVVPDAIARYFQGKPAELSQDSSFKPLVPGRAVPDVAMDGDPNTGMLIGQTEDYDATRNGISLPTDSDFKYTESRVGGTSLSTPLFAGIMADADQAAGKAHGFANPALYKDAADFRDITDPASPQAVVRVNFTNSLDASGGTDTLLRSLNQTNTIHTIAGYDDVTGLGTPRGVQLLHDLAPDNATVSELAKTGQTATNCKRHTIHVRLRHHKRDFIRRVVIHLAGHKRVLKRGANIRRIAIRTPARKRKLTTVTTTKGGLRITTVRHINACGLIGKGKETHRAHVHAPRA